MAVLLRLVTTVPKINKKNNNNNLNLRKWKKKTNQVYVVHQDD